MGCEMIAAGGSQLWNSNNFSFSTSLRSLSAWREAFEDGQRQSTINHMTQKSIEIASDVQEYAQRPSFMPTESTTGANDSVIDFGELVRYEMDDFEYDGDRDPPLQIVASEASRCCTQGNTLSS